MSTWREIAFHGGTAAARAFVAGFVAGRNEQAGRVLFGDALDLEPGSLGARLRDLVLAGAHGVLIAPEPVAVPLAHALAEHGPAVGLGLERVREITSAAFGFRVEVFSADVARDVRGALLEAMPAGVTIEDRSEAEERHPDVHGVELYAPVHAYAYRASGRITGAFAGVLEMHRRARALDVVEAGRLHLDGRVLSGRV